MTNYFNYFTEIEERFQQRRGSLLMLSTLDWALIEAWRESGVPLEAVLRGIDNAFDRFEARTLRAKGRVRKVNGLAWCAQSVAEMMDNMRDAAVGSAATREAVAMRSGFETERVSQYLEANALRLEAAVLPFSVSYVGLQTVNRLRSLAEELRSACNISLEDLDRTLTVLEERLFGSLVAATPEKELFELREQARRELAPYYGKMQAMQIRQVQQQFLQKRLLEAFLMPRLSLFYMSHE